MSVKLDIEAAKKYDIVGILETAGWLLKNLQIH